MQTIYKIQGSIQNYIWGGETFIPKLLKKEAQPNTAYAEYWLGVHKSGPATLATASTENTKLLPDALKEHDQPPLPFLFKILDVKSMLSIQVHPNVQQAQEGYEKENSAGIALNAKNRNYKDASDKPELMVALSPFWLLHGIAPTQRITKNLNAKPYLMPLLETLNNKGIQAAYSLCLDSNNANVQQMHTALKNDLLNHSTTDKNTIDFWVTQWIRENPNTLNGILSLYFMNLVALEIGQAIYQPPGLLHAYLEGQNVELMANSDNVLRAGLTPKHIDVNELLSIANLNATNAEDYILQPLISNNERTFKTPFTDFELSSFTNPVTESTWTTHTPELLFCYSGSATVQANNEGTNTESPLTLHQGEAAIIHSNATVTLNAGEQCVYRVKGLTKG